jgi:hypothetical protein
MLRIGRRARQLKKALEARTERENIKDKMPASTPVGASLQSQLLRDVLIDYKKSKEAKEQVMDNLTHEALVEEIVSDFFQGLMDDGYLTEDTIETENIYEILEQMNIVTAALNEYFSYSPEDIFEED